MVALGILSLSLIVMLETQASSVVLTAEARKISVATQLADEKLGRNTDDEDDEDD